MISLPPPSSGGVVLCESLNLLSGWPVDPADFHSAQSVHYMTESLRRAFRDRNLESVTRTSSAPTWSGSYLLHMPRP